VGLFDNLLRLGGGGPGRSEGPFDARGNPPRKQSSPGSCAISSCAEDRVWTCSYREKTGRRCNTRWCKNHIEVVGSATYCHRHAAVVRALSATEGSILEVKSQPSLDDRAVPLLNLICEAVDADVTALFTECAAGRADILVGRQKTVQEVWIDQDRVAWQVSWGLSTSRGYLLRAAIRVGVPEPPVVQAVVANHVIFQGVPYWIARRVKGEPADAGDQGRFMSAIAQALRKAVRDQMPQVESQLEFEAERFGAAAAGRY
jgi:hypothetical protein